MKRYLFLITILMLVAVGSAADIALSTDKVITLDKTKDINTGASVLNFYDNSSYDLKYRENIYQLWQPIVEYSDGKSFIDEIIDIVAPSTASIVDNKIDVKTASETKITYEVTKRRIKESVVLDKPANRIYYKYDLKSFDKVFNTFNASETTHVYTFGQELPFDNITKITTGSITKEIALAEDNVPVIKKMENGNLSIQVNEIEVFSIQKPFGIDAEGTRYEMDFEIDYQNKTIDIVGDLSKAVYPITIDPTTSFSGSQTLDGHVYYSPGSVTYASIHDYTGTGVSVTTGAWNSFARLYSSTTSNQYQQLDRAVFLFNTSSLDDSCTVTGVKFATGGYDKYNNLGSIGLGLTGFTPLATGSLSAGDYKNYTKERWADTDISYSSFSIATTLSNNWTGNSLFISNVSKTGWTPVMLRLANDIDNTTTGITWASAVYTYYGIEDAGTGGATPVLEVTYTTGGTDLPKPTFTSNVSIGNYTLPVLFNSTSDVKSPTAWNWSIGGTYVFNTTTASASNMTYNFSTGGNFSVFLGVLNASGYNTSPTSYINVLNITTPSFTTNTTSGVYTLAIGANYTGNNGTVFNWSLGDGTWYNTTTYSSRNTTKAYSTGGKYTLLLNVSDKLYGFSETSTTISVYNQSKSIFTQNKTAGLYPQSLGVNFTGVNTTWWNWSWGDNTWTNTTSATSANASKIYSSGGNFTITLNTSDSGYGYNQNTSFINIYNQTKAIISTNISSGLYTLVVQGNISPLFNVSIANWSWGDGTWTNATTPSTLNATKSYSSGGTFTITLNTSDKLYGFNQNTTTINVYNHTTSNFLANVTTGPSPLPVLFNVTSFYNATTYNWTFGVANFSNTMNATYTFVGAGAYTVVLNVSNGYDYNITTRTNYINPTPPVLPIPNFTANLTTGMYLLPVQFNQTPPTLGATMWNWSFGAGEGWFNTTTVASANTTHTYSTGGKFDVTLYITNATGMNSTTKTGFVSVYNQTKSIFTTNVSSGLYTLAVGANISGQNNATIWNWSWGDGTWTNVTAIGSANASKSYSSGGTYTLTLNTSDNNYGFASNTTTITIYNHTISGISTNVTNGLYDLHVRFNVTKPVDNASFWNWSFGDGQYSNTTQNSTHIYGQGGVYTIALTAGNAYDTNTTTLTGYISVYNHTTSAFTSNVTNGASPLPVLFNTTSFSNGTVFNWTFGAANYSSVQNATYTFTGNGLYTVKLNVSNAYDYNITTINNYIDVHDVVFPVVSDFSSNISKVEEFKDTVQFTDTSTNGPTTWNWTFGDGTQSGLQNPNHTWPHFGIYTVHLNASNSNTTSFSPKTTSINVTEKVKYLDFTANVTKVKQKYNHVYFTQLPPTYNISTARWYMEDGLPGGWNLYPGHTYNTFGLYDIALEGITDTSSNVTTKSDYINVTELMKTNITASTRMGPSALTVNFGDASTNATGWNWTFGAANFSNVQNPTYVFTGPGVYSVTLNASSDTDFNSTTFTNWITVQAPVVASASADTWYLSTPGTINFVDTSTGGPTSWYWDFGDGGTSTLQNPSHEYLSSGLYTVTLFVNNTFSSDTAMCFDCMEIAAVIPFNDSEISPAPVIDIPNETGFKEWMPTLLDPTNDQGFPVVGFVYALSLPYTDAFKEVAGEENGWIFYLILWGILLIMIYKNSGKIHLVAIIAAMTSGAMWLLIGENTMPWSMLLLSVAIAATIYSWLTRSD